jgi:hypothetical protein
LSADVRRAPFLIALDNRTVDRALPLLPSLREILIADDEPCVFRRDPGPFRFVHLCDPRIEHRLRSVLAHRPDLFDVRATVYSGSECDKISESPT